MNRFSLSLAIALASVAGAIPCLATDAAVEREVATRLERLRAIQPVGDSKAVEQNNKQMDEAWKYYDAHRVEVLPILGNALAAEIARDNPSNLVLLDTGYYLYSRGTPRDKEAAAKALFALDPSAKIVQWNQQQLFYFAHAVAAAHDPRVLPLLDKAFLRGKVTLFVPQHAMQIDETLSCVFVYGAYGKDAEERLRAALADPKTARKAIEILVWIGTPRSNAAVRDAMLAAGDYDTFVRFLTFMMRSGGPEGRAMVLAVDTTRLDDKARAFYQKVRPSVEKAGASEYRGVGERFPGDRKLSDDEVKKRLAAMRRNFGKDESTNPGAILDSGLPKDYLIGELLDIRALMLNRVSDEALGEVEITNAVLNGLRYRDH